MTALLTRAADTLVRTVTSPVVITTVVTLLGCTVALMLYERAAGRQWRRYFTRPVLTDVVYSLFYNAGIFAFFWYPLYAALSRLVPSWVTPLASLPPAAHFAIFLVVSDFALYWKHRLMHRVPALWRIHAIHHSQQEMTLMTTYRFHVVDELFANVVRFAVGIALGVPVWTWLPATALLTIYQSLQHADTNWSFGILDRLFVSSRFHNVHHSADAAESRANFGLTFSAWDFLFGTASDAPRPARYGVSDLEVPESFFHQLVFPFRRRTQPVDRRPAPAAVAAE